MADIAKVKRNIGKMIDQGAPDSDIDAYMADEGVTMDQLKFPSLTENQPTSTAGKVFQPIDDTVRVAADSMTRGYLDKALGAEDQAKTRASRERLPWWVETPTDIAGAVVASPYRIGSMGVGALAGGAEGALSAYGHQKDWIPDTQGWWDIAKGTGEGVVGGAVGARIGEAIGGSRATKAAEEARPYKTQADIDAAAAQGGAEAVDRAAVSRAAEAAQGSPRDSLAQMLSGMNLTPDADAKVAEIAAAKGRTIAAGKMADETGKKFPPLPLLAVETVVGHGIPWKTLGGMALKTGISKAGKSASQVSGKEAAALADVARNDALKPDPAAIDRWRDIAARIGIGYGRSQ